MNVQDLIDELSKIKNKERLVLISKDPEGNGFNSFTSFSEEACVLDGHEYMIGLEELTDEFKRQGYTEEDVLEDGNPCVVLWS